jgi:hypothetical protein
MPEGMLRVANKIAFVTIKSTIDTSYFSYIVVVKEIEVPGENHQPAASH